MQHVLGALQYEETSSLGVDNMLPAGLFWT